MSADAVFLPAPLIAGEGRTTAYKGAGILESACGVVDDLKNGDWGSFGGNLAATGLSALGAVMDPLQAVFAAGVGWLMEHVSILREPLDKLAGDPQAIEAHISSWRNVEQRIQEATDYFVDEVNRSTAEWASQAAAAYRRVAQTHAESVQALGMAADAIGGATAIIGGLVGACRNTIRDIVADVVGACISKAVQAFTVVLIPKVLSEIGFLVGTTTNKILNLLNRLLKKLTEVGKLMRKLDEVFAVTQKVQRRSDNTLILMAYREEATGAPRRLSGLKQAYDTIAQGHRSAHGSFKEAAVNSAREASQANLAQATGQIGDTLHEDRAAPHPTDLPL